jgi:hypothetical protein
MIARRRARAQDLRTMTTGSTPLRSPRIVRIARIAHIARIARGIGSRGRRPRLLPAAAALLSLLCLFALAAAARQPSQPATTGGQGTAKAGKERAKAAPPAAAAPAPPRSAAPPAGAPGHPGAAGASGAAGKAPAAAPASPGAPAIGSPTPDMGNIDQILEGDEEVLAGGSSFTYDPGNRRDPFKSLLIAPDRPEFRGPRPEGIPGLLIDEIDLKGIFRTARGYVAQVNASNQKKSYLLKEGDQLYDGDVMSIGKKEVVFKQIVQDPTALKPFREIVKSLTPGG